MNKGIDSYLGGGGGKFERFEEEGSWNDFGCDTKTFTS